MPRVYTDKIDRKIEGTKKKREEWDNFLVEMPHRAERLKVYSSFSCTEYKSFFLDFLGLYDLG